MSDHTQPLRADQEQPLHNAYGRGFMNGYELACADAVRELKRLEVPAEVRGVVAAMVMQSADRWNRVMELINTPARTDAASEQDARGGQYPS
jgi:hypothetical protein